MPPPKQTDGACSPTEATTHLPCWLGGHSEDEYANTADSSAVGSAAPSDHIPATTVASAAQRTQIFHLSTQTCYFTWYQNQILFQVDCGEDVSNTADLNLEAGFT